MGRMGPYRVLRVLGGGGMGVVFEALEPQLERRVALKAMRPALAANEVARRRFLREARTVASLQHDHVVTIHQVGEERGVPFLVMPLLQGESLEDRLKREGRLPPAEVFRLGREVAEGLAAAHALGLVHRDVKPGNIWLEARAGEPGALATGGRVKLLDFGLARPVEQGEAITEWGAVVGTPGYIAPEQARGQPLDARADLFSLGCVLYHAAAGRPPFRGDGLLDTLLAIVQKEAAPVRSLNPEVPEGLAAVIMRLLAKRPEDRPASARAVVEALRPAAPASGPPTLAAEPPAAPLPLLWSRPSAPPPSLSLRGPITVLILLAVVLILGPIAYYFGESLGGFVHKGARDTGTEQKIEVDPRQLIP
jgi:serine/threonine protein kinase